MALSELRVCWLRIIHKDALAYLVDSEAESSDELIYESREERYSLMQRWFPDLLDKYGDSHDAFEAVFSGLSGLDSGTVMISFDVEHWSYVKDHIKSVGFYCVRITNGGDCG